MSFKRMMRPYMISAAIIALTTFTLSSYVIPKGSVTRLNFEDRYIKPKKQNSVSNVQLEVDSGVIAYIDNYNNAMKTGNRFSLDKFVDKKLVSHLTARRITYDTATVHKWTIHDYMVRELDGLKEKITKGDRIDSIINMEPSDFLIMKNQQEMLTSPELSDYIEKQKRRGFANIKEFEIEYHKRIAMSFASFILTIIGVSLSSRKTKGGMGLHLGIGLGLSFSYILPLQSGFPISFMQVSHSSCIRKHQNNQKATNKRIASLPQSSGTRSADCPKVSDIPQKERYKNKKFRLFLLMQV